MPAAACEHGRGALRDSCGRRGLRARPALAAFGLLVLGLAQCADPAGLAGRRSASGAAQPLAIRARAEVNLADLTRETQKQIQSARHVTLVWWVPEQFWSTALRQNGSPIPIVEGAVDAFRPYLVFLALDAETDAAGALTFESEANLRSRLQVRDGAGQAHAPLEWSKVNPETANLLATLKPMLAKSAGAIGSNFYPFVFAAAGADGAPIADPLGSGRLEVQLGTDAFAWDLPLASLVEDRVCPVDGRVFNGTYRYCPYHGVELRPR